MIFLTTKTIVSFNAAGNEVFKPMQMSSIFFSISGLCDEYYCKAATYWLSFVDTDDAGNNREEYDRNGDIRKRNSLKIENHVENRKGSSSNWQTNQNPSQLDIKR